MCLPACVVNLCFCPCFFTRKQTAAASFDSRSDDKGIEPEGLAIAEIDDRLFVFVALERVGGFMCWDITDPTAPVFQVNLPKTKKMQEHHPFIFPFPDCLPAANV